VREPFGEPCVLKMMEAPGADKQRLRFAQEGVVLAKIAHANVVRVLGAGAWGESPAPRPPGPTPRVQH
jgi:hypothetical protein